jgi:hypothetical protein
MKSAWLVKDQLRIGIIGGGDMNGCSVEPIVPWWAREREWVPPEKTIEGWISSIGRRRLRRIVEGDIDTLFAV